MSHDSEGVFLCLRKFLLLLTHLGKGQLDLAEVLLCCGEVEGGVGVALPIGVAVKHIKKQTHIHKHTTRSEAASS